MRGDILDMKGKKLGSHEGIINYTIGQRRGIKIAGSEPLYVIGINPDNNSITVGTKKNLIIKKIELRTLNVLGDEHDFKNEIDIKIRSTGRLLKGKVIFSGKKALVEIIDEETGISPGQACVFYKKDSNGDKLLGGGWIDKTFNKNLST